MRSVRTPSHVHVIPSVRTPDGRWCCGAEEAESEAGRKHRASAVTARRSEVQLPSANAFYSCIKTLNSSESSFVNNKELSSSDARVCEVRGQQKVPDQAAA